MYIYVYICSYMYAHKVIYSHIPYDAADIRPRALSVASPVSPGPAARP